MKNSFTLFFCLCLWLACGRGGQVEVGENEDHPVESTPQEETISQIRYVAAMTGMNLREEPGVRGKVIKLLPYGATCEIISYSDLKESIDGLSGSWILVKAEGQEGYIFDGYTLPYPLPGRNPSTDMAGYFREHMIRIGNEEIVKKIFDPKSETYKEENITEDQIMVQGESDQFEKRQSYAGGSYLIQEIGYEYEAQIGFIPEISIQEGFLLARAIYPSWGNDACSLNLGKMNFQTTDREIVINETCIIQIKTASKDGKLSQILISNNDIGYAGLEITDTGAGVEIKNFFGL